MIVIISIVFLFWSIIIDVSIRQYHEKIKFKSIQDNVINFFVNNLNCILEKKKKVSDEKYRNDPVQNPARRYFQNHIDFIETRFNMFDEIVYVLSRLRFSFSVDMKLRLKYIGIFSYALKWISYPLSDQILKSRNAQYRSIWYFLWYSISHMYMILKIDHDSEVILSAIRYDK